SFGPLSTPRFSASASTLEYLRKRPSTFSNPKGWKMVAGGRGGNGARPPGYGAHVGCTPAGVPEPLFPCWATPVSGTPPGCSRANGQFPVVVPPLPPNDHRLPSVNPSGWSSGELVFAQVLR